MSPPGQPKLGSAVQTQPLVLQEGQLAYVAALLVTAELNEEQPWISYYVHVSWKIYKICKCFD